MKFNQYLLTEGSRGKELERHEFENLIRTSYSDAAIALTQYTNAVIYRGVWDYNGYAIVDPTKGKLRRSLNTTNEYTLIIDNSPLWKDYPKRSRSLVCSTNYKQAEMFGDVGIVIPKNGTNIGECPDGDFWISFPHLEKRTSVRSLDEFNYNIQYLIGSGHDKNWATLRKELVSFDRELKDKGWEGLFDELSVKRSFEFGWNYEDDWEMWVNVWKGSLMKTLNDLFDPNKNRFKHKKAGDRFGSNVELWVGGESLYLSLDVLRMSTDDGRDYIAEILDK